MRVFLVAAGVALVVGTGWAHARVTEIYKCVGEGGRPLYTSEKRDTKGKKCEVVSREVNVVPAPPRSRRSATKNPSPAGFPKESTDTRAASKNKQMQILERELVQEKELLAKARKSLEEQEAKRSGDERNYSRVLERLQPYRDNVEVHKKNVEALERELGNFSR